MAYKTVIILMRKAGLKLFGAQGAAEGRVRSGGVVLGCGLVWQGGPEGDVGEAG